MSLFKGMAAGVGLAALGGAGLAGLYRLALGQPQSALDGVVSPPGVGADVEIVRDRAGVPHLYAANRHDLYYALGYVHAQDRLWQMEVNRRLAQGRLAEIFGPISLTFDRFMRRLGLVQVATAQAIILDAEERTALGGYVAGINGFLETHRHRLPLEFRVLRTHPERWAPVDVLAWGKAMSWLLSANWDSEWLRSQLVEQLGPEGAAAVEPSYPAGQPVTIEPGVSYAGLADSLLADFRAVQQDLSLLAGGMSNAWAIAPARSATGGALLASDPHLQPQLPSIWYEAHLGGDGLDVSGATLPGLPVVLIGHNQRIAWGITVSMVDTQDLFVERLDPVDPTRYLTPLGSAPLSRRIETIRVRGQDAPVIEEVQETRHGPSLTPLLPGESRLLTVQSPVLTASHPLRGALHLNAASDWESFRAAMAEWDVALNFVYADVDGNIGYQLSGQVPRRQKGTGALPAPGWDARYDWAGLLTPDELPHVFNPPAGYVISANHRLVGDAEGPPLSSDWVDGFRALRIEHRILAKDRHDLADLAAMQLDVYSEAARQLVDALADLEPPVGDPLALRALEYLRRWDYCLGPESVAATIYTFLRHRLLRNVFGPRLGPLFDRYTGLGPGVSVAGSVFPARVTSFLITQLRRADPDWLSQTNGFPSWTALKAASLTQAVADLQARLGEDPETWQYGRLHQIRFNHVLGQVKPLDRIFNRGPYPIGGDADTPHQTSSAGGSLAADGWIPSYRQLVDLANLGRSQSIHTTGQSGLPGSPHYDDFIPLWRAGRYHPMLFDRQQILADLEHLLVLRPR